MSVRNRIFSAALALALGGGISAAVTPAADAATPGCGATCLDIFDSAGGPPASPAFVLEALGGGLGRVGQPVVLARASSTNKAEDFDSLSAAPTSDYFQAGLIPPGLAMRYGCEAFLFAASCPAGAVDDIAFEIHYIPPSGFNNDCVGVATTPTTGTPITLQLCGLSARTLWIYNPVKTASGCYATLINAGADSSFSDPYVLTSPGYPSALVTFNLQASGHGLLLDQLWGVDTGALPKPATCQFPSVP